MRSVLGACVLLIPSLVRFFARIEASVKCQSVLLSNGVLFETASRPEIEAHTRQSCLAVPPEIFVVCFPVVESVTHSASAGHSTSLRTTPLSCELTHSRGRTDQLYLKHFLRSRSTDPGSHEFWALKTL